MAERRQIAIIVSLGCIASGISESARAGADTLPTVRIEGRSMLGTTYDQSSTSPALGSSDASAAQKLTGQEVMVSATIKQVQFELGLANYAAKGDSYFGKRQDTSFTLSYWIDGMSWLAPSFGYLQTTQSSDRTRADAPLAFIDKTAVLSVGLQMHLIPFSGNGHGVVIDGRYNYLTSGEAAHNFGDYRELALGYIYKSDSMEAGVKFGLSRMFLNASRDDSKDAPSSSSVGPRAQVRSVLQSNFVALFFNY